MDRDWYKRVVRACCLDGDFKQLAAGDQTMLGEMGSNLSGGQKSRISLARALYRKDASIVMIDCTLSSLDAKVSKKVMERAIIDLCSDKLVIFVTHDLDHAAQMD